jgi:23S rRNA (guanosine2251-2'-O)-methyltransferase
LSIDVIIYGLNPVLEALRSGRVREIRVSERRRHRLSGLTAAASKADVPLRYVSDETLDRQARGGVHQGVVAEVDAAPNHTVADLIAGAASPPLLIVLDGIEDPQNFGAILRSAEAARVDGVVHQTRRSAPLSPSVSKASAGALAHLRLASVVNISRALEELKAANIWVVGLAGDGPQSLYALDLTLPTALVVGAEQSGLRRLVRERCDWLAAIPMRGRVSSLNVSVAAGIALFETLRQRARTVDRGRTGGADRTGGRRGAVVGEDPA